MYRDAILHHNDRRVSQQSIEDRALREAIRNALTRERHFPLKLSIVLRSAFKHLGLYIFKHGDGQAYLTPFAPASVEPDQTVPIVGRLLKALEESPGCKRQKLVELLNPAGNMVESEIAEVTNHLRWLIRKGHVIEFADGRLCLPRCQAMRMGKHPKGKAKKESAAVQRQDTSQPQQQPAH